MARTLDDILASRPTVDRAKIEATTEKDIRRQADEDDSHPAASLSAFAKRSPGQRGPGKRPPKVSLTIRVDPAVLDAWRESGAGWQGRARDLITREAERLKKAS